MRSFCNGKKYCSQISNVSRALVGNKFVDHSDVAGASPVDAAPTHYIFIHLTHWGQVMHICISKLIIIGSDNGLSPGRPQAIIGTNAGILSIGPIGTNFSEILIEIDTFSFKKVRLKMLSGKWRPFCFGLNVLTPVFNGLGKDSCKMRQETLKLCDVQYMLY